MQSRTHLISESITYVTEGAFIVLEGYVGWEIDEPQTAEPKFILEEWPVYALKTVIENIYSKAGRHDHNWYATHEEYIEAGWEFVDRQSRVLGLTVTQHEDELSDLSDGGPVNIAYMLLPKSFFNAHKERITAKLKEEAIRLHDKQIKKSKPNKVSP